MSELVHLPPLSVLSSSKQPVEAMIDEVAGFIGGKSNPNTRTKALTALDRAADRLNSFGVFLYQLKEATFSSSDLVSGATSLELPSDWGWPTDLAGVYHSDGTLLARLEWKTWDIYKGLTGPTDSVGTPVILSQKGIEDGLQVFPAIDPAAFTTIKIPYYARIRRPSEASELLMLPETREALIAGGEFMVMRFRYAKFPNIWGSFRDDFERTCEAAIGASKRWLGAAHMAAYPEEAGSLPSGATPLNPGTVYIRI